MKREKCRGRKIRFYSIITHSLKISEKLSNRPVSGLLLVCVPALIYGCSPSGFHCPGSENMVKLQIHHTSKAQKESSVFNSIDVFVFNDDILQRLDSYTRLEQTVDGVCDVSSRNGPKIMGIIANSSHDIYEWSDINSFRALCGIKSDLEDEKRDHPVMSGIIRTATGEDQKVNLKPLCSKVILRSIRSDFKGKPYEGKEIKDISVYLINVNARCSLMSDGVEMPERIINCGRLSEYDLSLFKEPELIRRKIPLPVGNQAVSPDISLICYPNTGSEDTSGSPFTRLVIEGVLDGEIWYWPININREDGNDGVRRNCTYIYDITITGKGSTDPDIVADPGMLNIKFNAKEWLEKDEYGVYF